MSHSRFSSDEDSMEEAMDTEGPSIGRPSSDTTVYHFRERKRPRSDIVEGQIVTASFDSISNRAPAWCPFQLGTPDDKFTEKVRLNNSFFKFCCICVFHIYGNTKDQTCLNMF